MMFKMIREAQAVAALGDRLTLAKQVQQMVGLESLADASKLIAEQFDPSQFEIKPEYYNEWMAALQGEAEAQGVDISRKQDFMDFAHMMLENDPRVQELGADDALVQKIVSTLWTAARAAQSHAKVSQHVDKHIQKTREEEEAVDELVGSEDEQQPFEVRDRRALPRLDTRTNPEDKYPSRPFNRDEWMNTSKQARQASPEENEEKKKTPYDEWMNKSRARNGRSAFFDGSRRRSQENEESGFSQVMKNSIGMEDESKLSHAEFERDIHKNAKSNPYPVNSLRHALWADMHRGAEDEEFDQNPGESELSPDEMAVQITGSEHPIHSENDGDNLETRVDDLEDRIADLEHDEGGDESERTDDTDGVLNQERDDNPEMDMPKSKERPEPEFDEEEAVKSFFRKAITSPKEMLSKAVKDIESEGASAWMKLNMPANPHPRKSQAHAAWAKGMKNAAKEALGLHEKPTMVTSKPKPRRK